MAPNDDLVHALIESTRNLSAKLAIIETTLEHFIEEFKREREAAGKYRHDLRDVIATLSGAVKTLSERVDEMRPDVADYRRKRDEAQGAAKLGKFMWSALVVIAGFVGALASRFLDVMMGRPPGP